MDIYKYRLCYYKKGNIKFVGFIDLTRFIIRALRRTNLPVHYSCGFNPQPRISFSIPIPVGVESKREWIEIYLSKKISEKYILEEWNRQLPIELQFYECYYVEDLKDKLDVKFINYELEIFHHDIELLLKDIGRFYNLKSYNILVRRGEKIKILDLKDFINEIEINKNKDKILIIAKTFYKNNNLIRGEEIINIFTYKPFIKNQVREILINV